MFMYVCVSMFVFIYMLVYVCVHIYAGICVCESVCVWGECERECVMCGIHSSPMGWFRLVGSIKL